MTYIYEHVYLFLIHLLFLLLHGNLQLVLLACVQRIDGSEVYGDKQQDAAAYEPPCQVPRIWNHQRHDLERLCPFSVSLGA